MGMGITVPTQELPEFHKHCLSLVLYVGKELNLMGRQEVRWRSSSLEVDQLHYGLRPMN